jgi:hypothetical protein
MKRMGMYCKAYQVSQLRQFTGWIENTQSLDVKEAGANGEESPENKILSDDDLVYLQENHVVTKDIFIDEDVVFSNVTPEWQDFCRGVLMFQPVQDSL